MAERDRAQMRAVDAVLGPFERKPAWRAFRSVLCPVDFSKDSRVALRYADALARRSRSRLHVQYVNDPLLVAAAAAAFHDRTLATTNRRDLRSFADEVLGRRARPRPTLHISRGHPADAILKLAARTKADLIVLGTHGLRGAERVIAGSIANDLLKRTSVPVLAIPPKWRRRR